MGTTPEGHGRANVALVLAVVAIALAGFSLWSVLGLSDRIAVLERPVVAEDASAPAPPHPLRGDATDRPCTGEIAPDMVRAVVGRHGNEVFDCFRAQHEGAEAPSGRLEVVVAVGADGGPQRVELFGVEPEGPLTRCVAQAVLAWRFPAPLGGSCALVSIPFTLGGDAE